MSCAPHISAFQQELQTNEGTAHRFQLFDFELGRAAMRLIDGLATLSETGVKISFVSSLTISKYFEWHSETPEVYQFVWVCDVRDTLLYGIYGKRLIGPLSNLVLMISNKLLHLQGLILIKLPRVASWTITWWAHQRPKLSPGFYVHAYLTS